MPNTPYMGMTLPIVGVTPGGGAGTAWGPLLTQSLDQVDAHNHSPGSGAPLQLTAPQFVVLGDLGFGGHNLFSIQNITASGTLQGAIVSGSFTGSLTQVGPGLAYLIPQGGVTITTNSLGQIIISSSAGQVTDITGTGGSTVSSTLTDYTVSSSIGADKFGAYLLLSASANDTIARIFTLSSGSGPVALFFTDGGAGGNFALGVKAYPVFLDQVNKAYTTASVTVYGGITGSITQLPSGQGAFIVGTGSVGVSTGSLGQVIASGSIPTAYQIGFVPLTGSNWNPVPTTTGQALNLLAAPNATSSIAVSQSAVVTASVSIATNFAKNKSGVVSLSAFLVVNPNSTVTGSGQFFRDTTPIGPSQQLSMASQVTQNFGFSWLDTLPDNVLHAYSFQVSGSTGTLTVLAGQGSIVVRELS
jgi:hypothetical protein